MLVVSLIALTATTALAQNFGSGQWDSSLSVEQLGKLYLENEASKLNFNQEDKLIDNGRPSSFDDVSEQEGTKNVDTVEFSLENNKDLPSQSRLTEHTYETNKRIVNNRNTRLERYNINNYITNDHTNYRTRIHNPHTITEVVNHNYRQIKPYVTTYVRKNVDTVTDEQTNPTEESTERTEEYDVEKLPVEHNVVDNQSSSFRVNRPINRNYAQTRSTVGIINRPINRQYARTTSPTSRFGLSSGSDILSVERNYNSAPVLSGSFGSSSRGVVRLSGTNTNQGFGPFNIGGGSGVGRRVLGGGYRSGYDNAYDNVRSVARGVRGYGSDRVNSYSSSRGSASGSANIRLGYDY